MTCEYENHVELLMPTYFIKFSEYVIVNRQRYWQWAMVVEIRKEKLQKQRNHKKSTLKYKCVQAFLENWQEFVQASKSTRMIVPSSQV